MNREQILDEAPPDIAGELMLEALACLERSPHGSKRLTELIDETGLRRAFAGATSDHDGPDTSDGPSADVDEADQPIAGEQASA